MGLDNKMTTYGAQMAMVFDPKHLLTIEPEDGMHVSFDAGLFGGREDVTLAMANVAVWLDACIRLNEPGVVRVWLTEDFACDLVATTIDGTYCAGVRVRLPAGDDPNPWALLPMTPITTFALGVLEALMCTAATGVFAPVEGAAYPPTPLYTWPDVLAEADNMAGAARGHKCAKLSYECDDGETRLLHVAKPSWPSGQVGVVAIRKQDDKGKRAMYAPGVVGICPHCDNPSLLGYPLVQAAWSEERAVCLLAGLLQIDNYQLLQENPDIHGHDEDGYDSDDED